MKRHFDVLLVLLLFTATLTAMPQTSLAHPTEGDELFPAVIEQSRPSVVFIQVERSAAAENPYKDDPELSRFFGTDSKDGIPIFSNDTRINFGSGFIFRSDGYILTNSHVVNNAQSIRVTLQDKRVFTADLVGTDPETDIGVIKIETDALPAIPLGNSDQLKAGQWVLAFGSPYQHIQSVTAGIVSATGRNSLGISDYENFIQTDAAINPGNSGGPLVNTRGEVVGINTAFQTQAGGYIGIGFAVPINMARSVAEQLIASGAVVRGWLGVALVDADTKRLQAQNLPPSVTAALVKEVKPESPAQRAGLQSGDLITAINGFAIAGAADVRNRVSLSSPNSTVLLEIYRNGARMELTTALAKLQD